jgi:hypothetical protein
MNPSPVESSAAAATEPSAKRAAAADSDTRAVAVSLTETTHRVDERAAAERRERVAVCAYYLSEQRGFMPGFEVEDWLTAELLVGAADAATQSEPASGAPRRRDR